MSTPTEELFSRLDDYLGKKITLCDLESWLVPRLPLFLDAPDSMAGRIAGAIDLSLNEYEDGLITENTLRKSLKQYLAQLEGIQVL
jgi:hypothetical protein